MDTLVIGKTEENEWYCYTLRPISDVEAIRLGLHDRAEKKKVERQNKTKKS